MQEIALQLEFLVVMDAVEDIGRDLKQLLNEGFVGELVGVAVDLLEHLVVALERLALELLVCVDLVTLGLKDPAQRLRVHVIDVALAELERIAVVLEHLVIVYLGEVLAEKKLGGLWVLLCLDVVEFDLHFVVFRALGLPNRRHGAKPANAGVISRRGIHQILLIHEQTQ